MDGDAATQDIYHKIDREKAIINAANHMRQATSNASVNSQVESQIRDARRNIEYFEQTLQILQTRKSGGGMENLSISSSGNLSPPPYNRTSASESGGNNKQGHDGGTDHGISASGGYSMSGASHAAPEPGNRSIRARPNYSNLDLIKYDTAHLGPRIQLMLSQLEFKLSVEKQYKDGIDKMVKLYEMEGDRKSRGEAELRRTESSQKIQLLKRALREYEDLHVDVESGMIAVDADSLDMPGQRKPLTGHLSIDIHAVADVEHAASGRSARGPDRFVTIKLEQVFKGRTKATKNDRWMDEQHEIDVDKAAEIEFAVYEESSGNRPILIGLVWIRLLDLVDEIRRKRMQSECSQAERIVAERMDSSQPRSDPQSHPPPNFLSGAGGAGGATSAEAGGFAGSGLAPQAKPIYIDAWFSLEPVGKIQLTLTFTKQVKDRKPFDIGLNRQGAVRQKKEYVVEQYGHKFSVQTFYSVMRCALCRDFLTAGMQCIDCKFTCHQKCYPKVITRCISKLNAETDLDGERINHRIPHRFDAFSKIGAHWCCHCGYMLPMSKRQARKCTECKLTCHADCVRFVPDFCGMSMESANQILAEMKKTKARRTVQNSHQLQPPSQMTSDRPTSPPRNPSFAPTPNDQDLVSQNDSDRSQDKLSYGKERIPDSHNQPPQTYSVESPVAHKQQRPPHEATPSVVAKRKPAPSTDATDTARRIGLDHFDFLAVLGRGNFGKVMLAEAKATKQLYAIKVLKKEFIIENDEVESTHSEKRIFLIANKERHPFLYNLHACFQTETRIYFVIEYISGGDLMLHIQRGAFGTKRTQFYAAEVCLALKYFHENGVIYRDLKMDNILLNLDGHIKIADFGLCKPDMWDNSTTNTFCGTPEFMAPEILLEKKYGKAVDWWAFGVLIYQMLLQQSPFRGEDEDEIYNAILTDDPLYPNYMPQDSVSFLQKLLTREPELRLGSGPTGAQEIMNHAFFRNVNWDDVYHKRVPAPFLPTVKDRADTSNFDQEFTSVKPGLTPVHSVLSQAMQEEFRGFSYSADSFGPQAAEQDASSHSSEKVKQPGHM